MSEFRREVRWEPGPMLQTRWLLHGESGAVQFLVSWGVGPNLRNYAALAVQCYPMPVDLGYHSPEPTGEWDREPLEESCEVLGGRPCYYDGSSLNAKPVYLALLQRGEEGVWEHLEDYYRATFGREEAA